MRKFGFLVHPLSYDDVERYDPGAVGKGRAIIKKILEWIPPYRVSDIVGVRSAGTGEEITGHFIGVPIMPEQWLELKEVLTGHCAAIGRDVNEITCSVNVRIESDGNLEPVVAAAASYRDVGVDLIIVNLPLHPKPDSLKPLAEALGPLS